MSPPDLERERLQIRMFGPYDVRRGEVPLGPLRSRKGQWLLALLVLRHGREVTREWLAETLWPDSMPEDALRSLRQSLFDLRGALGPEAGRLSSPTPRTLRLDLSGAEADVIEFDAAVRRGDPCSLERAVSLYAGPLLEGCSESWILAEREERQGAYLDALETLARHALAGGETAGAVGLLRRAAAVDLLRQEPHRTLMQVLAREGEHAAAVEVYQELRRRLHREMSAEPDFETTAIYQEIRARAKAAGSRITHHAAPSTEHAAPQHPLPRPLTALIGRETELREVGARLLTARLVTLTGTGGVGKTRLALEVAREVEAEYAQGCCFVDLSAQASPEALPGAVSTTLGVPAGGDRSTAEMLVEALRPAQLLLVLDNCEHLLEGCARLADRLLRECPGLRVLATSRQRLGITGEVVRAVAPLSVPSSEFRVPSSASIREQPGTRNPELGTLLGFPSVRLFVERVTAVCPGFGLDARTAEAVARICGALDGVPLALELAAALAEGLDVAEIAAGLDHRFDLLASGDPTRPERQRSLRAMLDWSYELLSEPERALFRRLSVFAGGWTLRAAEAVARGQGPGVRGRGTGDGGPAPRDPGASESTLNPQPSTINHQPSTPRHILVGLVSKSLVVREEWEGKARYRMLETVREYARQWLEEAGEAGWVRDNHLAFYLRLAEEAAPGLTGPEQDAWLSRLDEEYGNLRAALDRARQGSAVGSSQPGSSTLDPPPSPAPHSALRLAGALGRYWQIRGLFTEARQELRRAREADSLEPGERTPRRLAARAEALSWEAFLTAYQGEYAEARQLAEESLSLWEGIKDLEGAAGALGVLAVVAKDRGSGEDARELFQRSLALWRETGNPTGIASTLGYLGILAQSRGDYVEAQALYSEALALRRRQGDRWGIAASLNNLGLLALKEGNPTAARPALEEVLSIRRGLGDRRCIAVTLGILALAACEQQDATAARGFLRESLEIARELGDRRSIAYGLEGHARLAALEGQWPRVAWLLGAAGVLRKDIGAALPAAEQDRLEELLRAARKALEPEDFEEAQARGAAADLAGAIRFAQEETDAE